MPPPLLDFRSSKMFFLQVQLVRLSFLGFRVLDGLWRWVVGGGWWQLLVDWMSLPLLLFFAALVAAAQLWFPGRWGWGGQYAGGAMVVVVGRRLECFGSRGCSNR